LSNNGSYLEGLILAVGSLSILVLLSSPVPQSILSQRAETKKKNAYLLTDAVGLSAIFNIPYSCDVITSCGRFCRKQLSTNWEANKANKLDEAECRGQDG
jgi:hypothetical protein